MDSKDKNKIDEQDNVADCSLKDDAKNSEPVCSDQQTDKNELVDGIEEGADGSAPSKEDEEQKAQECDWHDKYLRLHADWENYRRRMDEQRADERVRASEKLMSELLPLIDDMQRSLDYAKQNGEGDLLSGFEAVYSKFIASLEKHGLELIDPKGEPFDPIVAQAVGTVENEDEFDETVSDVYQKGYRLGIKVLRPAMVTITTGGKKRQANENIESDEK